MRIGVDVHEVEQTGDALRVWGDRYRRRLFTDREIADCGGWGASPESSERRLAERFAAKEAALKTLRPTGRVPGWREIEVRLGAHGEPRLRLSGTAARLAGEAGITALHLSLSRTRTVAVAMVVGT